MTAPNPPSNTPENTGTPSSLAPPTGLPAVEPPQAWRAGQHADPRLAGRSAEEILGIAQGLLTVADRFNQPTPQPAMQPANRFDLDISDDEYVDGRKVKAILSQLANQGPPVDEGARQVAAQALWSNVQILRADEFRRWKGEIENEARKLPIGYWSVDNLNSVVDIVKSRHIDELAAEKAQRLVNESHPTIRSGTGGSGSGPLTQQLSLADDRLPKGWVDKAKALGIDEGVIAEFCRETGQTPEQYLAEVEKYGKGAVIRG